MPAYNNEFARPDHYDHDIVKGATGKNKVGTLRVKPVSILWKPSGERKFHCVSLDDFVSWITATSTGARRVKS